MIHVGATFAVLADPTRRAIRERLRAGEAPVVGLAGPFDMTARALSQHLGVLEVAGLLTRERDAQRGSSWIRAEPLVDRDRWLEGYRRRWDRRCDRLDEQRKRRQKGKHHDPTG